MENEKQSNLVPASSFAANHPELFQKSKRDDAAMHDQAFETKPISYFRGAMMRFAKNKASIVAAVIIFIIILYAIIVPFASPKAHVDSVTYPNGFQDPYFSYALPYNSLFKGTGFWDGTETKNGISDRAYDIYRFDDSNHSPIAQDYGTEPRLVGTTMQMTHNIRVDSYAVGNKVITVNAATYQKIVSYEQEKGIYHTSKGIMKPLVYYTDNYYNDDGTKNDNPGYCAQYRDIMAQDLAGVNYNELTTAQTDIQMQINNVVDAMQNYYNQNSSIFYKLDAKVTRLSGTVYTQNSFSAIKTASDQPIEIYQKDSNGSYVYDREFHDDYTIRVDYFDYFTLIHGFEPHYFFGANASGQDIFLRLAQGARFSLLLGVGISLINILIGVIWGSISGYYGGTTDLIMERVTDIISGIPSWYLHLGVLGGLRLFGLDWRCGHDPYAVLPFQRARIRLGFPYVGRQRPPFDFQTHLTQRDWYFGHLFGLDDSECHLLRIFVKLSRHYQFHYFRALFHRLVAERRASGWFERPSAHAALPLLSHHFVDDLL